MPGRPRIYNLFPRLVGPMTAWPQHAARARDMGFDWIYLNPVQFPGFSGSCYAIQDPDRIDPLLLPTEHPDAHYEPVPVADGGRGLLRETLATLHGMGLRVMVDLVLNHTSRDALLAQRHPEWYVRDRSGRIQSPSAIDPADARRVTVWGDLAELQHEEGPHREALWRYWEERLLSELEAGVDGFRCDAAYKVPAALWRRLVGAARQRKPGTYFLAETLGARLEQVEALADCGVDAFLNSSKYWNFDAPWFLEQQQANVRSGIASIAFPESHDTPRLWSECGGRRQVMEQRYAVAAAVSSGVLMPIGFEFGFERPLHVVETRPDHWEEPHTDLVGFIRRVNESCEAIPAFQSEVVQARTSLEAPTLLLERGPLETGRHGRGPGTTAWIAINKDWSASHSLVLPADVRGRRVQRLVGPAGLETAGASLVLAPAEVAYL